MYIHLGQTILRSTRSKLSRRSFRPLRSNMSTKPEEILQFWFGADHVQWFGGGEKADNIIRDKYADLVQEAFDGKLASWKDDPRSSLALIIVCDQLCRNVHKGTSKMYGLDPISLALSHKFLEQKTHNHLDLGFFERVFTYMPLEHSEDRGNHVLCTELFEKLVKDAKTPEEKKAGESFCKYAYQHKEVVDRFGRYPQRNAVLNRENTREEAEFLENLPSEYKW